MTVLLVVASEDDGGVARVAATLATRLPDHGVRVVVALQREGTVGPRLAAAGVVVHVIPELIETLDRGADGRSSLRAIARNISRLPSAVRALRALAQKHDAAILYGHGSWPNHLVAEATRDWPHVAPRAVWHVHSAFSAVNHAAARTMLARGDVGAIIAVSRSAAAWYERTNARIEVIHNGVAIDACRRAAGSPVLRRRLGLDARAFIVGYAGRLVAHKGIHVIARAAGPILDRIPHAHIAVLGGAPASARTEVVADLRRKFGEHERVHLCGYVDDVLPHIAGFDVALTPSTYADPCPLSVLEALGVGVPVVASRIGGIPEIVDDGIDGLLVPPGDPVALARAVVTLGEQGERRRQLAAAAAATAAARFDQARMVASVAAVLRSVSQRESRDAQV
jgi:glycosyltransferase involved in cell wall biosynthesis